MLIHNIKSRQYGEVEFRASKIGSYIFVGLHSAAADRQICDGGYISSGHAISSRSTEPAFILQCRRWWRAFLQHKRDNHINFYTRRS